MLKKLLLLLSVLAVASGSALGPTVARAGLVSVDPHPGGGNPHPVGGSYTVNDQPYVEIWTDRGTGSVYRPGERVDVFMQPAYDCFVIIYDIDTDGNVRLLFPYDSRDDGFVRGGEVYRLGMSHYGGYRVTGPSGIEYVHVLASFEPFRPVYWHGQAGYASYAHDATWRGFSDYWGAAVPPRVYGDPFVAMQSINEFICYDALEAGIAFADFTYFYVEHRVSYPRYLCYDCHGYRPAFHPYADACSGFHISFVACDPCYKPCSWWWWCSPKRVYCGPSYVCYSKKPCKETRPSYKWRTRSDSYRSAGGTTSYGDYYKERVRSAGQGSGGGRTAEVVRVRPEREMRPDGNTGERDLYSRKSSREAVRNTRPAGSRPEVRTTRPDATTTRPEVRTVPVRIERPRVDGRKVEAPEVESRKVKQESGWSRLVKVVKTTIERESGKKESDPKSAAGTSRVKVSGERKSDNKTSRESSKSTTDARKARTTSTRSSQSKRRRVSD